MAVLAPIVLAATLLLPGSDPASDLRVLVFSKTAGFRHASIPDGVAAIRRLGAANGFDVDATEDGSWFTDERLAAYDAVVFLSTTGDILDDEQEAAFERFVQGGGGYVGIHAAADTEYDWPWYGSLVGGYFKSHPRIQPADVLVVDRHHPATAHLPRRWRRTDEWYNYRQNPRGSVHVLASLDERSYEGGGNGHDHPTAWCHKFDGGRAFYTGGGHTSESFVEPLFMQHVLGGIRWAAGVADGEAGATIDAHFDAVVLDDFVTDPMELAVAADGRVVFVERGGVIKIWKPDLRATVVAGFLDVFTALEDGLLGVALDPGFDRNGFLYVYYSPAGDRPVNVLSRLTLVGDRIDPDSEIVMLEVETQREECCHSGGSITFDDAGRLYLSTGDNTSPFASDGYTPIDERPGRMPFDAQKSSANTHDLRGKILRITPRPDGTYDIPEGNLFTRSGEAGRPEIYVMGCRNPLRISVDDESGYLYWGEVGPDAGAPRDGRGPAGHDEFNRTRTAGNFGWPYFTGPNLAYHDYDFASGTIGAAFDPRRPINDSPNSTGARELPPARPAWIGYTYGEAPDVAELGTGGRCAMAGPTYRHDPSRVGPRGLPAYYDGMVFLYEWARNWIIAVSFDDDGEILDLHPFMGGARFVRPMDLEVGPDGCLYLIEWGTGFGGGNPDARLVRLEYYGTGERPPIARAAADVTSGPLPLAVALSASGSAARDGSDRVELAWDLDGDGATDATGRDVAHVYDEPGTYVAQLRVTDHHGLTSVANVTISAGNTRPHVAIRWPPDGGFAAFGEWVAWQVHVADTEDVEIADDAVIVQPLLGHDTHAHPLQELSGHEGAFQLLRDDGHGADADLFTVLEARYADRGAAGLDPLTGRETVILHPKRKQAEYATRTSSVRLEKADDAAGGGQALVLERDGAYATYAPVNLTGIDGVTLRVAPDPAGGALELRLNAPDGPLLGAAMLDPSGVELAAGPHELRVEYFERGGGAGVILRMSGPGLPRGVVPEELLVAGPGGARGLDVDYYALDDPTTLPDFASLEPFSSEIVETIDYASTSGAFAGSGVAENVGAVFHGQLLVPRDGTYAFSLESDDGSRLFIDGAVVVDNDGLHAMVERTSASRWTEITVPVRDPGGTHELHLVYRTGGTGSAPTKVNWLRFEGAGVASASSAGAVPPVPHGH